MPERRIPWRRVASKLGGKLEVKTVLRATEFSMRLHRDGIPIVVRGRSAPYSLTGGETEISARTPTEASEVVTVLRDMGEVPVLRRFFRRDVNVGDTLFDVMWLINGSREATTQAYLGAKERKLIAAVPGSDDGVSGSFFYNFDVRGHRVVASTIGFERDADRMISAIEAVVALARRPQSLRDEWRALSARLDGTMTMRKDWRMDGTTRIAFAHEGSRMSVSPAITKLGWRRDRLVTRISCDHGSSDGRRRFSSAPDEDDWSLLPMHARAAFEDAKVRRVHGARASVSVDLDGNVLDADRLRIAATGLLHVAGVTHGVHGPYR